MKRWPIVPLADLVAKKSGSVDPVKFQDEEFDLYSIPAFDAGQPEVRAGSEIGSTKQIVQPGDVLLSKIVPHIRRAWVVGENRGRRIIASGEWIVFRNESIHPDFLRNFLLSDPFHTQFMQTISGVGGSLMRARPSEVAKIKTPLPPLAEQARMVKLLDEADELRKMRVQTDRRTANLIPALFNEMFGGGKFKSACVGELTSLVTSGSTPRGGNEVYTTKGPYFIRSQNVRMNYLDLTDAACLPADVHAQMTRTKVSVGDVLLNITGASIGRVTWVEKLDREANVSQHVCLIRPKSDLLNATYLSVFISLPATQRFILQIQSGASRQALNHQQVRTLEIPLPPIQLQKEFAQRVTEIRDLEASQAISRTHLEALFQSMLHRAFNGELQ